MKRLIFIFLICTAFVWQSQAQWLENFDESMDIPSGWNVLNEDDGNEWGIENIYSQAHSSENVVSIKYNSNAHDDYLITPLIENVNNANSQLSFWVKSSSSNFLESYDVRLSTVSNSVASDFSVILVTEQEAPNEWTKIEVDLSSYEGQNVYVAIHATGKDKLKLYVDDVENYGVSSCPSSTGLTESDITLNGALLNWESETIAVEWEVIYGYAGFDPETEGTTITVSEKSYTLTNLEHSTRYDWYVRALCGDEGIAELSEKNSFNTLCSTITTFPFEEDFSSNILPTCWSQEYIVHNKDWDFNNGEAIFNNNYNYETTKLITSPLDLSNLNNPTLTFDYKLTAMMFTPDELRIYYRTSADNAWELLSEYTEVVTAYKSETINLPEPSATYFIAFEGKSTSGYAVYIDNVAVKKTESLAIIDINPIDYNYGNIQVDQSEQKDIIISNTGNVELVIDNISQEGSTAFSFVDETPITIAAGESYTLAVTFTPNTEGTYTGTLTFNNTTAVDPTITLNGLSITGGSCEVPTIVNSFPYNTTGTTCGLGNIYDNTAMGSYDGGEDAIYKIVVNEDNTFTFTMSSTTAYTGIGLFDGCPNTNNLVNKHTNFNSGIKTIEEQFLEAGEYYLMIDTYASPDCIPEFELSITIEGNETITPPSINVVDECGYSILTAGDYTGELLWNTGENTESITVIESGTYSLTQTVSGTTSEEATVEVTIIPTYDDIVTATTICASETPLTFGSQELLESGIYSETFQTIHGCDSLVTLNLTVNVTPVPEIVNVVQPTPSNEYGSFEIANYNSEAIYTVTPNENVTQNEAVFTVLEGSYMVTATLNGCVSEESVNIVISGQPIISMTVTPENHDYGTVEIGQSATQTFIIENTGNTAVEISDITLVGNAAFITDAMSNTIAVGENYSFDVIFTPLTEGLMSATLTIANNSDTPSVDIALSGTGEAVIVVPEIAIWDGSESADWFTPENWDVNAVPGDITDVIIPSGLDTYPTISVDAICKNISFEEGATLLGFELLSVIENAFFNQSLTGGVSKDDPNAIYHCVSAPVNNPAAGTVFPLTAFLREYNETTQMWENLLAADVMEVGKGYSLWMAEGNADISYQGNLNKGVVEFSGLTLTDDIDNYSGWHLLGNPYPAALDMDNLTFSSDMQASVSVWSVEDGSYITWNGTTGNLTDGIIPVGQGFFVKVNQDNVNFSLNPEACVHNGHSVYKSVNADVMAINVKNNANNYNESAFVTFSSEGENGYDRYDVIKLNGLNDAPALYTKIEDKPININSRYSADDMVLYFNTNIEGSFTLNITDFDLSNDITIEDRLTGAIINCAEGVDYEFTANPNDDKARFIIHFKGIIEIPQVNNSIKVFERNNQIVVENLSGEKVSVMIYNINGQLISSDATMDVETQYSLPATGLYIVKVQNSKTTKSDKIIIE